MKVDDTVAPTIWTLSCQDYSQPEEKVGSSELSVENEINLGLTQPGTQIRLVWQ